MATTAQLAQLAQAVYADTGAPSGWERLRNADPNPTGYEGTAFARRDAFGNVAEIVIAHRGTEPTSGDDLYADLQMGLRKVPDQYQFASAIGDRPRFWQISFMSASCAGETAK